jgi:hypothetical protein
VKRERAGAQQPQQKRRFAKTNSKNRPFLILKKVLGSSKSTVSSKKVFLLNSRRCCACFVFHSLHISFIHSSIINLRTAWCLISPVFQAVLDQHNSAPRPLMDDSILERAKLLSQAANQMATELSHQADEYKVRNVYKHVTMHCMFYLDSSLPVSCCVVYHSIHQ